MRRRSQRVVLRIHKIYRLRSAQLVLKAFRKLDVVFAREFEVVFLILG